MVERLVSYKHSSLLGPFKSYEVNEVLYIQTLGQIHNTSFSS